MQECGDFSQLHTICRCRRFSGSNSSAWTQVVGCIVEHEGRVLLCRRAIEPCKGLWTVPAGFLEMGESTAAGAARETWEEANARVEVHFSFHPSSFDRCPLCTPVDLTSEAGCCSHILLLLFTVIGTRQRHSLSHSGVRHTRASVTALHGEQLTRMCFQ